jgi:four helix bundle protein
MAFSHEKLDVYKIAIEYTKWAFAVGKNMSGAHRHARDQLFRASQSIPLNIAEGNGKATEADRRHFFEIARGSTLECAAIQDVLEVCGAIRLEENRAGKDLLDRIAAMLTKIGGRGYMIKEDETGIA